MDPPDERRRPSAKLQRRMPREDLMLGKVAVYATSNPGNAASISSKGGAVGTIARPASPSSSGIAASFRQSGVRYIGSGFRHAR